MVSGPTLFLSQLPKGWPTPPPRHPPLGLSGRTAQETWLAEEVQRGGEILSTQALVSSPALPHNNLVSLGS